MGIADHLICLLRNLYVGQEETVRPLYGTTVLMVFPVVQMWELDHKEVWAPKNWCFCTVVLEKVLRVPWTARSKPVSPKGNQPWIFIGRTDAEAETPILWPPDVKSQLIGKDPDAGKDWRQTEKGMIEDKMVGQHHRLNGHEFEQALRDGEGQGSLACCSPWGHKELDMTEELNNSKVPKWIAMNISWLI